MNTVIDVEEGKFIQLTVLYVSLVETLTEEMLMYVSIVFVQSRCILEKPLHHRCSSLLLWSLDILQIISLMALCF